MSVGDELEGMGNLLGMGLAVGLMSAVEASQRQRIAEEGQRWINWLDKELIASRKQVVALKGEVSELNAEIEETINDLHCAETEIDRLRKVIDRLRDNMKALESENARLRGSGA